MMRATEIIAALFMSKLIIAGALCDVRNERTFTLFTVVDLELRDTSFLVDC